MPTWPTRRDGPTAEPESAPRREMPVPTDRPDVKAGVVSQLHFVPTDRIQAAFETRYVSPVANLTGRRPCMPLCASCGQGTRLTAVAHP